MPAYYAIVFGPETGSYLYSYCFTANCFSTLLLSLIIFEFQSQIGYQGMLMITLFSSIIALITVILMKYDPLEVDDEMNITELGKSRVSIFEKGR